MNPAARLYLVGPHLIGAGRLAGFVPELVAAGVDMIQLREKNLEAGDVVHLGGPLAEVCAASGVPFIVNDRIDVAAALNADGVHLGQSDLHVSLARRLLPQAIVGRSTHSEAEIDAELSAADPPDYIAVGPVFATPTKPGRPPIGIGPLQHAVRHVSIPWFAIGGIDSTNLAQVLDAGARRIVVVRAITEAKDPVTAAAELKGLLDQVPL